MIRKLLVDVTFNVILNNKDHKVTFNKGMCFEFELNNDIRFPFRIKILNGFYSQDLEIEVIEEIAESIRDHSIII